MSAGRHYLAFETGGTKLVAGVAGSDARILATVAVRRALEDRARDEHEPRHRRR